MIPSTIKKGTLDLLGVDGNAFSVIAAVAKSLKVAGNAPADIEAVKAEMRAGNYDHLLSVAQQVTETGDE